MFQKFKKYYFLEDETENEAEDETELKLYNKPDFIRFCRSRNCEYSRNFGCAFYNEPEAGYDKNGKPFCDDYRERLHGH